jgi:acetolactate synthase I/II/III large subunit
MLGRQWLRLLTDTGGPARLMEACVKWSFGLNTPAILAQTMQRACQLAMAAPRGPVLVSVPAEYLLEDSGAATPGPTALPCPPAANPEGIEELARALIASRHPLIITEEAGREPSNVARLVALAEALGAPVLEAWQPYYLNFPREHRLYGGIVTDRMVEIAGKADAILLVDAVVPWHPPSALPKPGQKVFVLGEDPLRSHLPHWGIRADLIVPGELGPALETLTDAIRGSGRVPIAACIEKESIVLRSDTLDTRWIAHELNDVLPRDAIVVNETITHRLDLLKLLTKLEPGGFYESSFGGLGVGLGTALGVKYAHPGRTVVATIGDGAFHYNPVVASFGAAQELRMGLLVILFDNAGYLSQKGDVVSYFPHGTAVQTGKFAGTSITPRPEYVRLAEAYGGYGERVERPAEVRGALLRGLKEAGQGRLALLHMVLAPVNP